MAIISIPSPNFSSGRKSYHPEAVVIHIMDGTLTGTDSWFKNPQSNVSAHYGIGKNGEVHQYVQEVDTAWHAGRVNAPTWSLIKPTGSGTYINPNLYTIGIEHEGDDQSDWTDEMYNTSRDLLADICKRWNIPLDRSHIIGHREIYSLKTCPGAKVDLNKLVDQARKKSGYVSPSNIVNEIGKVTTTTILNLRRSSPSTNAPLARTVNKGTLLGYIAYTDNGEEVKNNKRWYQTADGLWFWGGRVALPVVGLLQVGTAEHGSEEKRNWGFQKLNIEQLWNQYTGKGVKVAVLDSGVQLNHPDLQAAFGLMADKSFNDSVGCQDTRGHGTHCAGVIGARRNGLGVLGIAPDCMILIAKVVNDEYGSHPDYLAAGIKWAADQGAHIISMSMGFPQSSQNLDSAIQYAFGKDILLVAAGGNNEGGIILKNVLYPAASSQCIAVGCVDQNNASGGISVLSTRLDIVAPGINIFSTDIAKFNFYSNRSGTSIRQQLS